MSSYKIGDVIELTIGELKYKKILNEIDISSGCVTFLNGKTPSVSKTFNLPSTRILYVDIGKDGNLKNILIFDEAEILESKIDKKWEKIIEEHDSTPDIINIIENFTTHKQFNATLKKIIDEFAKCMSTDPLLEKIALSELYINKITLLKEEIEHAISYCTPTNKESIDNVIALVDQLLFEKSVIDWKKIKVAPNGMDLTLGNRFSQISISLIEFIKYLTCHDVFKVMYAEWLEKISKWYSIPKVPVLISIDVKELEKLKMELALSQQLLRDNNILLPRA